MRVNELNREQRNALVAQHSGLINRLSTSLTMQQPSIDEISMWVQAAVRIPEIENVLDNVFWLLDTAATAQGPNRKVRNAATAFREMLVKHRQDWNRAFNLPNVH